MDDRCLLGDPYFYNLFINFTDSSGHDILNGPYKKYDINTLKMYVNIGNTKHYPGTIITDTAHLRILGANYALSVPLFDKVYYLELEGKVTDSISFTYQLRTTECLGKIQVPEDLFLNTVKIGSYANQKLTIIK